jgi:probable metal-binding protein
MTSATSIHGHDIMHLLIQAHPAMTIRELRAHVQNTHGDHARFHTCSSQGMTLDELLTFLKNRGKITQQGECLIADPARMCQDKHGEHQ